MSFSEQHKSFMPHFETAARHVYLIWYVKKIFEYIPSMHKAVLYIRQFTISSYTNTFSIGGNMYLLEIVLLPPLDVFVNCQMF
jgi:hypothetical protein